MRYVEMKRILSGFMVVIIFAMSMVNFAYAEGTTWTCANCGRADNTGKFCPNCGTQKPQDGTWTCASCGQADNTGNYCANCGSPKAADASSSTSSSIDSAEGPWLPDVNTTFGVDGEYYGEITESNGITYDYYYYDLESDVENIGNCIVAYTEALKELDFEATRLKNDNVYWYESYAKGGYTAYLAISITDGAKEIANGGSGKWRAVIAVPEGMTFEPGSGAPGVRDGKFVCVGCNGTGRCAGCGGSGLINYGDGLKTCVNCNGSGICNICDGAGTY